MASPSPAPEIAARRPMHYGPRPHVAASRKRLEELSFSLVEAIPQAPSLGAEIRGVDLSAPLSAELSREIERALVEFKVLFFRDQAIRPEEHAAVLH